MVISGILGEGNVHEISDENYQSKGQLNDLCEDMRIEQEIGKQNLCQVRWQVP